MRPSSADDQARLRNGVIIFALGSIPIFVHDPRQAPMVILGVGVTIGIVVVVARKFWRYADTRTPARFTTSSSTWVRVATRIAKGLATYVVAFYTLIAVILLFGAIDTVL